MARDRLRALVEHLDLLRRLRTRTELKSSRNWLAEACLASLVRPLHGCWPFATPSRTSFAPLEEQGMALFCSDGSRFASPSLRTCLPRLASPLRCPLCQHSSPSRSASAASPSSALSSPSFELGGHCFQLIHSLRRHRTTKDARRGSRAHSGELLSAIDRNLSSSSTRSFTCWLASVDAVAVAVLIWEVALVPHLGANDISVARLFFAVSARPTLLLLVALLSYINVVRGKPVLLGRADIVVWGPSFVILVAGTGTAAGIGSSSVHVFQFLLGWSVIISAVVIFCFSRLLLAVVRVRRQAQLRSRQMMAEAGRSSPCLPAINEHAAMSTTFLREPEPRPSMASDRSLPYAFLSIDPSKYNMSANSPQSATSRSVSFDAPSSARPLQSPAPTILGFNTSDGLPRPRCASLPALTRLRRVDDRTVCHRTTQPTKEERLTTSAPVDSSPSVSAVEKRARLQREWVVTSPAVSFPSSVLFQI